MLPRYLLAGHSPPAPSPTCQNPDPAQTPSANPPQKPSLPKSSNSGNAGYSQVQIQLERRTPARTTTLQTIPRVTLPTAASATPRPHALQCTASPLNPESDPSGEGVYR